MLEWASSLVWRRSTSLRRLVTWEERVPAAKRAMKSLSWAIFFSRWAFCCSRVERIWVLAITMSSWPPVAISDDHPYRDQIDRVRGNTVHLTRSVAFCMRQRQEARSEEHTSELQSLRHLVCR